MIALDDGFIAETARLEKLLIEDALGAIHFVREVTVLLGLLREQVLELLELATGVLDFIDGSVESKAVLVLTSGFVVAQHAVPVLHREDFVVDATVVAVLIPQVVELLSELSNELVLLRAADLDASFLLQIR